jgi:hypothetical protein
MWKEMIVHMTFFDKSIMINFVVGEPGSMDYICHQNTKHNKLLQALHFVTV